MKQAWVLILWMIATLASAQGGKVAWSASLLNPDVRAGESTQVLLTAKIPAGWHIYGVQPTKEEGPVLTSFVLVEGQKLFTANGKPIEPAPLVKFDKNFGMELATHKGERVFALPIKLAANSKGKLTLKVTVTSQSCDQRLCNRPQTQELTVNFTVAAGAARAGRLAPVTKIPDQPKSSVDAIPPPDEPQAATADPFADRLNKAKSQGLFAFLGFAFSMGLLALVTPCVYPMIPITVSFFAKKTDDGMKKNVRGALAYSLGIMASFVVLGIAVTLIFGATGVQQLATNPFVNIFLALLFIVLALSLFGLFEIALPSSLVNRFSSKSGKGGLLGPVLMGVTFSLTTFTCSVPLVGTLLLAATQGDIRYPALGMLAFSAAFALPFFLLALFPQFLAGLPKSGGWLAVVKGTMGFLELAAALKFFSNVDLVYGWGLLPRPIFLSVWSGILILAGLYLFGVLVFGPAKGVAVGWGRRAFGLVALIGAGLCMNGVQGGSMGTFGAFLPPGSDKLTWIEDYNKGMVEAQKTGKPVFVDFTGVTCTNCRAMEQDVFPLPDVLREMEQMVRIKLYTDRRNEWAENDAKNTKLQQELTNSTALPIYVILSPDGKQKSIFPGSTNNPQEFVQFLRQGREAVMR